MNYDLSQRNVIRAAHYRNPQVRKVRTLFHVKFWNAVSQLYDSYTIASRTENGNVGAINKEGICFSLNIFKAHTELQYIH